MLEWRVVLLGAILIAKVRQGCPALLSTENVAVVNEADDLSNEVEQISGVTNLDRSDPTDDLFDVSEARFSCGEHSYPGYYSDLDGECQVFHICQTGERKDSFLCPKGTIFNQEKLVCDWRQNFDCSKTREFYFINEVVASAMRDIDESRAKKSRRIPTHG